MISVFVRFRQSTGLTPVAQLSSVPSTCSNPGPWLAKHHSNLGFIAVNSLSSLRNLKEETEVNLIRLTLGDLIGEVEF
jgi:hypothetical protein